ncbi:MAG: class I SAM-dependent methyltransferase [Thiohalomonadales bacterium]|nr:class I SAM-dependent methyltransferase [Thiohalomonadales bacterium]
MNTKQSFIQRWLEAQRSVTELPEPDAEARAHSQRLTELIRQRIREADGAIPFHEFMQLALHAPGLGYYSAGSRKFGEAGDFITAPETSPLFARCLARAIQPVLASLPQAQLLEVGAGSGVMAAGFLQELTTLHCTPDSYFILELSADLKQRQAETLQPYAEVVSWVDNLPDNFTGIVLANELLDAMPVHRVVWHQDELHECYVAWETDRFVWQLGPLCDVRLQERFETILTQLGELPDGYVTEINLAAEDWIKTVGEQLQQGMLLLIDYGFARHEFYHPQRRQGTLMCHYRHRAHDDPLILVGLQDITAHIDFTAIADIALGADLRVAGYTTQAHFLLGSGLTELVQPSGNDADAVQQLELANQIKRLTLPQEMGELFKVMALTKNLQISMPGFSLRDLRNSL